jgi:hypothetical protein
MVDEELDLDQIDDEPTQDEMELAEILDLPDEERIEREAELVAGEGGERPEADSEFFGPVVDEEGNEVQG